MFYAITKREKKKLKQFEKQWTIGKYFYRKREKKNVKAVTKKLFKS